MRGALRRGPEAHPGPGRESCVKGAARDRPSPLRGGPGARASGPRPSTAGTSPRALFRPLPPGDSKGGPGGPPTAIAALRRGQRDGLGRGRVLAVLPGGEEGGGDPPRPATQCRRVACHCLRPDGPLPGHWSQSRLRLFTLPQWAPSPTPPPGPEVSDGCDLQAPGRTLAPVLRGCLLGLCSWDRDPRPAKRA